jgi:hypothetical protein
MKPILVILGFLLLSVSLQEPKCPCLKAADQDEPHGANELIEYSHKTVKRIHGRVVDPTGAPIDEAVAEVYSYSDADTKIDPYKFTRSQERLAACVTNKNGNFCFSNLKSGNYLLRIGTLHSAGFQEVFIRVRLDRSWWSSWFRSGKVMEVALPLGT